VKKSVLAVFLCAGIFATDASAADVSIKGSLNQTVEGSDNYFLTNTPSGTTFKSLSSVNLDVLARTPTTRYLFDSNYSYYKYFGPGSADTSLTHGTPANARFQIDHVTELAKYNLAASWSRDDLASTLLTQTGVVSAQGTVDIFKINGGVTRDLSRLDSVSWTAQASKATYTDSTQTPYKDVTTTALWNHLLTPTTTLTGSVMFDWFSADDSANSQRLFWQIMTGFQSQLSRRLTINGSIGEVFANAYQSGSTAPIIPSSLQIQPGTARDWVANIGVKYQLLKTTNISFTAAQTVAPTILGNLQKSSTVGASITHDINPLSYLTLSTQFAHTMSFGTDANFLSAQIAYGYKLTREWRTRLSYTYRQREDDTGIARSSTVLLSLTRDFTILGNPTAIDEAEAARRLQRQQQSVGQVFPNFQ
jgi:hypothetical protein